MTDTDLSCLDVPPRVSVLMPTFNNAPFIAEAIHSVLRQTFADLELVVSDNASTDETGEIVAAYAARDPRVRYTRNPHNVGISGNFNLAYSRAHPGSEFLAILPSDDAWQAGFLAALVGVLEAHPEIDVAHCDALRVDPNGEVLGRLSAQFRMPPSGAHLDLPGLLLGDFFIHTPAAVVRRRALSERLPDRLFEESLTYVADYLMWLQLLCAGLHAYYLDAPLVKFRMHAGSITSQSSRESEAALACLRQEVTILGDYAPRLLPPGLEGVRRQGLSVRLSSLAFRLIALGRAAEAAPLLARAARVSPHHRAGKLVAWGVAALPLPGGLRAKLFRGVGALVRPRALRAF